MRHLVFIFILPFIIGCSTTTYVADIDTDNERIGNWHKSDAEIEDIIKPYKEKLDSQMHEVLAHSPQIMEKARPSSTLGNWFSDIVLDASKEAYGSDIDFSLQNYGGLRIPSLNKGAIVVQDIYELMPFDNKIVILELNGETTKMLLDKVAEYGGWPASKGLSMKISDSKAVDILINEKPFDMDGTYKVALADYIANGGDSCDFLIDKKRTDKEILIRDLIINYLKENGDEAMIISDEMRIYK